MAPAKQRRQPPKTQKRRPRRPKPSELPQDYWHFTRRPLQSLAFLLPLILVYEVSMALTNASVPTPKHTSLAAAQLLHWFFSLFGASWAYLPGVLLVIVLLAWHFALRLPWKIQMQTLVGMAGESLLLAIPLIGLNWFLARVGQGNMLHAGTPWEDLLVSIGAGIYEELVFRLIVIEFLTFVFNDVMRLRQAVGVALAVILSSLFFAVSHHHPIGSDPWEAGRFAFRSAAGAYLAAVYALRGFGLAVGAHVVYDVIAFLSAQELG